MIDIEKFIESENPQYFHRHFQASMAAWNMTTLHIASVDVYKRQDVLRPVRRCIPGRSGSPNIFFPAAGLRTRNMFHTFFPLLFLL